MVESTAGLRVLRCGIAAKQLHFFSRMSLRRFLNLSCDYVFVSVMMRLAFFCACNLCRPFPSVSQRTLTCFMYEIRSWPDVAVCGLGCSHD